MKEIELAELLATALIVDEHSIQSRQWLAQCGLVLLVTLDGKPSEQHVCLT
jgi:hypothetical protein